MGHFTYTAYDKVPEKAKVRIGYRENDLLENMHFRTLFQKSALTFSSFFASYLYYKQYTLLYGHYPILRASYIIPRSPLKQQAQFALPIVFFLGGIWFGELAYNRWLGIQGAPKIPDQLLFGD